MNSKGAITIVPGISVRCLFVDLRQVLTVLARLSWDSLYSPGSPRLITVLLNVRMTTISHHAPDEIVIIKDSTENAKVTLENQFL